MELNVSFPIQSEKEFRDAILSNPHYCREILNLDDEKLVIKNKKLQEAAKKLKTIADKKTKELNSIKEKMMKHKGRIKEIEKLENKLKEEKKKFEDKVKKMKESPCSVYKGMTHEQSIEYILKEVAGDKYEVINNGKNKKMDIRLHRKDGSFTIGVECKDKENVSSKDIEKFTRDKCINKFYRNIFISANCIKGFIEENNQVKIKGDELYIVSGDPLFIAGVMKNYLENLESSDGKEIDMRIFDRVVNIYNAWQVQKKQSLELDKAIMLGLELHPDFTEKMINGHIYLSAKSQFKCGKSPY